MPRVHLPHVVAVLAITVAPIAARQESISAPHAAALVTALEAQQRTAISTGYPDDPMRFAAALYIPGGQLLVISARYAAPPVLRAKIAAGDHLQVYMDLNAASARERRLFIEDLEANGLHPTREHNQPFDITWRDGSRHAMYNGDWQTQGLTAATYKSRFADDDRDYAAVLTLLVAALKPPTS